MRIADYITDALYRAGGRHVYGVTGGMIMHLTDALLQHKHQEFVACHHESAAVMAADAAGRLSRQLGVAYVTAGPGALNAIPAAAGAFVDSAPVVIVAGQAKSSQCIWGPRQFPLQGFHTLPLAKQVTKYAAVLDDPTKVAYHVQRAIYEATTGRPGPVWLEVPVDVQGMEFDPDAQAVRFNPEKPIHLDPDFGAGVIIRRDLQGAALDEMVKEVVSLLQHAKRPALLIGAGVHAARAERVLADLLAGAQIPVMTSRLGMDLVHDAHPNFAGRPGTYGERTANFVCQNADLLVVVGCRLAVGLVGYEFDKWAPHAKKVMVDIDPKELAKPGVRIDLPILADAGSFLLRLKWQWRALRDLGARADDAWQPWREVIRHWRANYPVVEVYDDHGGLDPYHFTSVMSDVAQEDDIFVLDTGSCFHVHAQAFRVKPYQRHIITGGLSTMGFMPAAIGASIATGREAVWCITGDGSLQMNLQELATIMHHKLPVKIVVHDNDGYLLIRNTQKNLQGNRRIGEGPKTGVSFPDLADLATTYGFGHVLIERARDIRAGLARAREISGPVIVQVMMKTEQELKPRVASYKNDQGTVVSAAYDDMHPVLRREEYEANQVWRRVT